MKNIIRSFESHKIFWCVSLILICIAARFIAGAFSLGYFDFRMELLTGEIAASGRNVYAEQRFYNYGPAFFIVLGWFYKAASHFSNNILAFKFMILSLLTLADLLTAHLIAKKAGLIWGLLFFLNPLSFLTASYLSQFDGIALAFAAYGIYYLEESAERESLSINDIYGIILLSLSLITKHILWALPLCFLVNNKIHMRKKILYAFIPPVIFLLSFMPYWNEGYQGIISNVFMYRARNNLPLFFLDILNPAGIYLPLQKHICFVIYGGFMLACAYIFRHERIFSMFLLYTISMVCFSSAISTQYLSIPCMALFIFFKKRALYYFPLIASVIFGKHIMKIIMVWALLIYLVNYYRHRIYS